MNDGYIKFTFYVPFSQRERERGKNQRMKERNKKKIKELGRKIIERKRKERT